MPRPKLFRWRAIVPLSLFFALLVLAAFLLKDHFVKRAVEQTGAYLVGAKVDVASADVRLDEPDRESRRGSVFPAHTHARVCNHDGYGWRSQ